MRSSKSAVASGVLLTWVMLACGAPTVEVPRADGVKPLLVASTPAAMPLDPATIDSASVAGDVLTLHLTHGGGCRTHTFALHSSGAFLESYPVQVLAQLSHDGAGDPCRALVLHVEHFDLKPLRELYRKSYGAGGELALQVRAPGEGGTTTTVRYVMP